MLILVKTGNYKYKSKCNFQWHDFHTKLHENSLTDSVLWEEKDADVHTNLMIKDEGKSVPLRN
jgi:hypothetical protein